MNDKLENALRQNLEEWVRKAGGDPKPGYGGFRCACPLHGGKDAGAFSIYFDSKWHWKCHSGPCGGGDVIDFIVAWKDVSMSDAIAFLTDGLPITSEDAKRFAETRRIQSEEYEAKTRALHEQALQMLWQARAWERYYNLMDTTDGARDLWRNRGIPDDYQNLWQLGYCPDFVYRLKDATHHSPSLTIPIFTGEEQPYNIRHRILNPYNPKDKYRPERPHLETLPFMADYQTGEQHDNVLVIEGEIKAMVTYIHLDLANWQIYGIPGKEAYRFVEKLKGRKVWIAFDPDADYEAEAAARIVGGRIVQLPMKIDDALTGGYINKQSLCHLLKMARKVL
jgi:hypothetical protein